MKTENLTVITSCGESHIRPQNAAENHNEQSTKQLQESGPVANQNKVNPSHAIFFVF